MCEIYFILVLKDGTNNKNHGNKCVSVLYVYFIYAELEIMC